MDELEICDRCECCSTYWEECPYCGGEGGRDGEELMQEDPFWYSPNDFEECDICGGKGGWQKCLGHCDENGHHSDQKISLPEPLSTDNDGRDKA